jgi:hypothetical protein
MIPAPRLDDRAFEDIVAEAVRLIPRYAPEWTNHNPSDPGITLIELAAWMTDIILYRLNRVPEKNYVAFLNLLGIKLKPPQAARALLTFTLTEGAERQTIREGTTVATPQAADEDAVMFETTRDLVVTSVKLDRCFSYWNETYGDNSAHILGGLEGGFEAFGGAERAERYLYLGDSRFGGLGEEAVLRIYLGCPDHGGRDMARLLEWEYWNGQRWKDFMPAPLEVERGEAVFRGPAELKPFTVHGIEDLWVRGRLAEVPKSPQETEIDTVRVRVEVLGEGVPPERALANLENNAFLGLDLGKNMWPFGKEPKVDCCLYLACRELLRSPGSEVLVEFQLAESSVAPAAAPSEDLTLAWEYWDGRKWRLLGKAGPRGVRPGASDELGFRDETTCLTKSGVVSFYRPKDMQLGDVNGEESYWIRARIEHGDFGRAGVYSLENDKWVWKDDKPLRPPVLRAIAFKYREEYKEARHVVSYNDFRYRDLTEDARTEYTLFQPFDAVPDESPTLYLGFDAKLPNESISLFFQMAENLGAEYGWESEQRVIWEYHNGQAWTTLPVRDQTKGFIESGFIDFVAPDDFAPLQKFTEERHWLRARLEHGGYVKPPRIVRILTDTVEARNLTTIRNEILGSSDGTPLQSFTFTQTPLLEGEVIEVREREPPSGDALDELGENAVREATEEEGGGVWVRWKSVDSFFESGPVSRHYVRDFVSAKVQFGDGRRGYIPQEGRNNIVARRYQVGGGSGGNVNSGTLTSLTRALAYVESVQNYLPAAGGADAETIEEAKQRAPYHIKSRDRAVTAEDFEQMALRATTSIARAKCLPDPMHQGQVKLVLVPKSDDRVVDLTKKLIPSGEILRFVKKYLDERRLVGTILMVVKPRYEEFSLKVTLLRRTVGTSDRLRRDIEERLRKFLHPLHGGRDAKGWPFGRPVLKSDLVHLVEEVPGVDAVDSLQMFDEDRRVAVEQIRLEADALPHVVNINVVEKVRDEIV